MSAPQSAGGGPILRNPFIVGNPVRDRSMFFGRETEFDLVRRRFDHAERGGLIVFCGERRSGKTSILFQIMDGRLGPDFLPVLIDMQSMAIENEVDFLGRISEQIRSCLGAEGQDLPLPDFTSTSKPAAAFQRFIGDLRHRCPQKTPILLFDEYELFENKIESGTLSEDILNVLASLMESHGVCLVFTGSQHLEQRKRPYWRILGKSIYRVISYLSRPDAISLMVRPVEGLVQYEPEVLDTIFRLTAGQPFYTQAVCQNLVDHLNEIQSTRAGLPEIQQVVPAMVDNPLPQMIFLWDGLEREEQIVLALLAERLRDEKDTACAPDLVRTLMAGRYALDLNGARIAAVLEGLFQKDFLLKSDGAPPGYSFRMDLWRLWVRRMHSVWQVMREQGMEIRHRGLLSVRRSAVRIAGTVLLVVAVAAVAFLLRPGGGSKGKRGDDVSVAGAKLAAVLVETEPRDASISLDALPVGRGIYRGQMALDQEGRFVVSADGYADSSFSVRPTGPESLRIRVMLQPRRGALRIETLPTGAAVRVDGRRRGQSPLIVSDLEVAPVHVVEADLPGRPTVRSEARVLADSVALFRLAFPEPVLSLTVNTTPDGAEILIDGVSRGHSSLQLPGLSPGEHRFRALLPDYLPCDTLVVVGEGSRRLDFELRPEPPGVLVVMGDRPSRIYIDGVLVRENVQNSGERSSKAGFRRIQALLVSGETVEDSVRVNPGEKVVYDYSQRRVVRRTPVGGVIR
jgi:hypothetical protein